MAAQLSEGALLRRRSRRSLGILSTNPSRSETPLRTQLRQLSRLLSSLFLGLFGLSLATGYLYDAMQLVRDPVGTLFNVKRYGLVGMDDVGRFHWCAHWNSDLKTRGAPSTLECSDRHNTTITLVLLDSKLINDWRAEVNEFERRLYEYPFLTVMEDRSEIVLTGHRTGWKADHPVARDEFIKRARELGVRSIGELYAACGFSKLMVVDQSSKETILSVDLTLKMSKKSKSATE